MSPRFHTSKRNATEHSVGIIGEVQPSAFPCGQQEWGWRNASTKATAQRTLVYLITVQISLPSCNICPENFQASPRLPLLRLTHSSDRASLLSAVLTSSRATSTPASGMWYQVSKIQITHVNMEYSGLQVARCKLQLAPLFNLKQCPPNFRSRIFQDQENSRMPRNIKSRWTEEAFCAEEIPDLSRKTEHTAF